MPINILIAEDHVLVREGLKAVIEEKGNNICVVAVASNGKEVLTIVDKKQILIDIFLIDISMPILNGIETTERLVRNNPDSKVIILSMYDSRAYVEKALKAGAKGYVLKDYASEELLKAIYTVNDGMVFICSKVSNFVLDGFLEKNGEPVDKIISDLTSREKEVLKLFAEGLSNKAIADKLNISIETVSVHRKNIMKKLNIHKQAYLVRYAIKEGISPL